MKPILYIISFLLYCQIWAGEPVAIYLTWQRDPTTTMTIQWLSKKEDEQDIVCFHKKEEKDWKEEKASHKMLPQDAPYLMHVVELKSLEPNTTYTFRLKDSEKQYNFHTLPKNLEKPLTFVAGGDTNQADEAWFIETCKMAASQNPSFTLFGGDLAYASPNRRGENEDSERWVRWLTHYFETMITSDGNLIPLIVTIGNHDVKGHFGSTPADAPFFYTLFAMPGLPGYNVLRINSYLSIYLLDSNHTNPIKGEQTEWLAGELSKDGEMLHRFALYHVPAYPSVRSFHLKESEKIRKHWVPLFEKYGLHVAIENHDHVFKRCFPLKEGSVNPNGVLYIGDGSWGVKPRIPKKAAGSKYLAKSQSTRQFLKIQLSETTREFWSIAPDGQIIDHYIQFVKKD